MLVKREERSTFELIKLNVKTALTVQLKRIQRHNIICSRNKMKSTMIYYYEQRLHRLS